MSDDGLGSDAGRGDGRGAPELGDRDAQLGGLVNGGGASAMLREAAGPHRRSRRDVLARAGAAAVASAGALTLIEARQAQAATGGNFILGQPNDADATTELHVTTAGGTLNPLFKVNGASLSGTSTTMEVDSAPGPSGIGLRVVGAGGATALSVSGASTSTTVGIAISVSGSGGPAISASASGIGVSSVQSAASGKGGIGVKSSASGKGAVGVKSAATGTGAIGILGSSGAGPGVQAVGNFGPGVVASSAHNRGGRFSGHLAQVQLIPSASQATHPASGIAGDLFVDKSKRLWFCKGGTNWKQLA